MGRLMKVATCQLNQWALDWVGNLERIKKSIRIAKQQGAKLRVGPELEIVGYMAQDHFLEGETYDNAMDMLAAIMEDRELDDIIIDLGMPVRHKNNRYNARVILLNGRIVLIRPKLYLAGDGNYREMRWFSPWNRPRHVEEFDLELEAEGTIAKLQGSRYVPIGDAVIRTLDTIVGCETCEELFTPRNPSAEMSLDGVEIFTNSSGSHHELRKLNTRISLIQEATRKNGGVYLYSNLSGGDGDRLLFDGCSMIFINGQIIEQLDQFSLKDVEVVTACIDIEEVRSHRFAPSRAMQATSNPAYVRVDANISLSSVSGDMDLELIPSKPGALKVHCPEEEISLGPAAWLWDYLRRSQQGGFLLPLSGGIDSAATATLVFSMSRMVFDAIKTNNEEVISDVRRICGTDKFQTPQELCGRLLSTVYMGMEKQSSKETRSRAQRLADAIGAKHRDVNIDAAYEAVKTIFTDDTDFAPQFKVHGGTQTENLALQNLQARQRMIIAYFYAQLLPSTRGQNGGLLVLGSGNVDEQLRGYLTKYDCSSADLNPIGSISKVDLKRFISWAAVNFELPILQEFVDATPTAELEPITESYTQSDEQDMGFTYAQLSVLGRLRKESKLGPYAMFLRLLHDWKDTLSPAEVADTVKRFHHYQAINRHKMTTMTPSVHAESYSVDDNRFDLRPFVYASFWKNWSFKKIDEKLASIEKKQAEGK
ncbi:glutamine-dependent NAD(+) synthetase with GAT domain-containing protein [Massarina eburnea CBS 473.64]|uniref:Glutamine-dependent NAD(+) synthetase n=1 Tax=Massarina eburnea CBS 473.64 TaxID=1395130 RepID=A0A6A6S8J2_9PLEO|nr:glutamine-dependent NAD(+) synthetase with GAT domain-containing protein [Massarina eburnea CBS 473.64]